MALVGQASKQHPISKHPRQNAAQVDPVLGCTLFSPHPQHNSHIPNPVLVIVVYHVKNQKVDLPWVQHPSPTYAYWYIQKEKSKKTSAPPVTASQNLEDFCSGPPPGTSS